MTNKLQRIQALGEDEISRWSDPRFGGVLTPGQRSGRDYAASKVGGDTETDTRFSQLDNRIGSIRSALEKMAQDPRVIEKIAYETGNPTLVEAVMEERELAEAKKFLATHPEYHRTQYNFELICDWLDARDLAFTAQNITRAYTVLTRSGELENAPGTPRPLSDHDRRAIALQASSGDVEGAATRFLLKRLPEDVAEAWQYSLSPQDALDDIAKPEFAKIIEEAVFFCWENGRPNYMPTPERRQFLRDYVADRIPNARLLDEAWKACQAEERDALRSGLLSQLSGPEPQAPTEDDLNELSDDQVKELYGSTRRQIAKDVTRRPTGIIQ